MTFAMQNNLGRFKSKPMKHCCTNDISPVQSIQQAEHTQSLLKSAYFREFANMPVSLLFRSEILHRFISFYSLFSSIFLFSLFYLLHQIGLHLVFYHF